MTFTNVEGMLRWEPKNTSSLLICLHGLGDTAENFSSGIFPNLSSKVKNNFKILFPTAPHRSVTINNGFMMPAWFDILSLESRYEEDKQGLHESADMLNGIIAKELKSHKDITQVVVLGFSQGGAVALSAILDSKVNILSVLVCSAYVPLCEEFSKKNILSYSSPEIIFMHGKDDSVVPIEFMKSSSSILSKVGYDIDYKIYEHGHSFSYEQLCDINSHLENIIN